MLLQLTLEQQQALDQRPNEPVSLVDPRTGTAYVLLSADVFAP